MVTLIVIVRRGSTVTDAHRLIVASPRCDRVGTANKRHADAAANQADAGPSPDVWQTGTVLDRLNSEFFTRSRPPPRNTNYCPLKVVLAELLLHLR